MTPIERFVAEELSRQDISKSSLGDLYKSSVTSSSAGSSDLMSSPCASPGAPEDGTPGKRRKISLTSTSWSDDRRTMRSLLGRTLGDSVQHPISQDGVTPLSNVLAPPSLSRGAALSTVSNMAASDDHMRLGTPRPSTSDQQDLRVVQFSTSQDDFPWGPRQQYASSCTMNALLMLHRCLVSAETCHHLMEGQVEKVREICKAGSRCMEEFAQVALLMGRNLCFNRFKLANL